MSHITSKHTCDAARGSRGCRVCDESAHAETYIVKLGNEYATGWGERRSPHQRDAFRFHAESSIRLTALDFARAHRDECHKGGKVLRLKRRKRKRSE